MKEHNSQERMLEIVQHLQGRHYSGMTNKELAVALKTKEPNICRDLAIFERYEWIVRGRDSRWRLSPKFGGIAGHIMQSYKEARLRLTEEESRYASEMQ
jgi:hypothetical protein